MLGELGPFEHLLKRMIHLLIEACEQQCSAFLGKAKPVDVKAM